MGSFYTNYTLAGPTQESVAAVLAGRSAMVSPSLEGRVVVVDEESEGQDQEIAAELAARLSRLCQCPLLAVMNHDDGILWFQLYDRGDLVDEYNSAPDYFAESGAADALRGPEGGDAAKLCIAFGVNEVARVESILRRGFGRPGAYVFEIERHADLANALKLPEFAVGAGFESVSSGAEFDEVDSGEWIGSKDLRPAAGIDARNAGPVPGYYKVSFRAHPGLTKSIPTGWMPGLWADLECPERSLSAACLKFCAEARERFSRLGYSEIGFKRLTRVLNPNFRESGGINLLGPDRRHYGQILYNRSFLESLQEELEALTISFTAVFAEETVSCTNQADYLGPVPNHHVTRLPHPDVDLLHGEFMRLLARRADKPKAFPDSASLREWYDASAKELLRYRSAQGVWVKMSDYEVEKARRALELGRAGL